MANGGIIGPVQTEHGSLCGGRCPVYRCDYFDSG